MKTAIEVTDLWESYRRSRKAPTSLRGKVASLGRSVAPRPWALKGVSLAAHSGEMLAVVGANGSGKSTLLRCLAGIFRPVKGTVTVRGRVSSLIDLTAGFRIDLSARDNILLSGSLYGISRAELERRMDDILEFAGLEQQSNASLRSFSTGMGMRLGFSLAVTIEPDILLVDEVLAVGDESFKARCLDRIAEMRRSETAIVFASHELPIVKTFADRVLVLQEGEVAFEGDPESGVGHYMQSLGVTEEDVARSATVAEQTLQDATRAWRRRQ